MMSEDKINKSSIKILGEVISGAVSSEIRLKLRTESEEVRIGFPAMVEGNKYDFFCIISDISFPETNSVTMLANAEKLRNTIPMTTIDTARGRTFYSVADLQCVQMIEKASKKTFLFETIPPYFSTGRLANKGDVELVYKAEVPEYSASVGTLRGVEGFEIPIDFKKLVEVPFGIFGRTHSGKTFLNKIIMGNIINLDVAQVLIFDMQSEYGWRSRADNSPGLKFFFEEKVTLLALDPSTSKDHDEEFCIGEDEIEPQDLIVAFQDLSPAMIDAIYEINRNKGNLTLVEAISAASLDPDTYAPKSGKGTINALSRRVSRLERLNFVVEPGKGTLNNILTYIKKGQSIVIDFGKHGADFFAYVFVANILSKRLYEAYSEMVDMTEYPRLVVLLEEAHKFLDPAVAKNTIFDRLAREMRKFKLVLAMVDQRPSKIDNEILSQLANRFILSLTDPRDIVGALTGPVDPANWRPIVKAMPPRTVLMFGDAIKAPTAMDVLFYSDQTMADKWNLKFTSAKLRDKLNSMSDSDKNNLFDSQ
ncbi:MAG: ATP-binding protein [Candidatus Hodarchaeales archaeon]